MLASDALEDILLEFSVGYGRPLDPLRTASLLLGENYLELVWGTEGPSRARISGKLQPGIRGVIRRLLTMGSDWEAPCM